MNGRSSHRFTKLVALSTVVAGAAVGVYQFTSGGLSAHLGSIESILAKTGGQLRADEPSETTTLDAVAQAIQANAANEPTWPAGRQAIHAVEVVPTAAAPATDELTNSPAPSNMAALPPAADPFARADAGDRYSASTVEEDLKLADIARGQAPAERSLDESNDDLDYADESTDQSAAPDAAMRARAAFSSTPPVGDDARYGGAASSNDDNSRYGSYDAPTAPAEPSAETSNVDPFAPRQARDITPVETEAPSIQDTPPANDFDPNYSAMAAEPDPSRSTGVSELRSARSAFADETPNTLRERGSWPASEPERFAPPSGNLDALGTETSSNEGAGKPGERALEGAQQPALVVQKLAPEEIQVGKPAKFQVVVHNVSQRPADAVVVHDVVPQGTRLISTTPRAEEVGGKLVWQLGTLSVGEQRAVEMLLMPVAEGEIGSIATVTSSTQASVKTRCTLPQLALRLTAPQQVMIGDEQRVKIELHNPGTGNATGVMLYETVPDELRHASGQALEFEIGTLRSGETRELELVLTAEKAGTVVNQISVRADGNLQVEQQIEFDVIAPALAVGVDGPRVRYLERPATYIVSIGNPGTAPAREIELVTHLPKGMRFVSANNLGEYDNESHSVYWSLAELPEGESGEVELVAMPIEPGNHEIKIEGRAQQGLEDETSQHVLVEGLAAIMFEVRDLEDPIEVGDDTNYEIRVVNQGTKAATGVVVRAALQPGLNIISASGETRHAIQAGAVVFEPLSSLAPKAETVYRIQAKGARPGDQRIAVEVSTDDIGDPIRKEESTRVFGDQ